MDERAPPGRPAGAVGEEAKNQVAIGVNQERAMSVRVSVASIMASPSKNQLGPRRDCSSSACSFNRNSAFPHIRSSMGPTCRRPPSGSIEAIASVAADVDQAGLDERPELQRDGPEGHIRHRRMNLPGSALIAPDQPQDLAPPGRGHRGEGGRSSVIGNNLVKTKILSREITARPAEPRASQPRTPV